MELTEIYNNITKLKNDEKKHLILLLLRTEQIKYTEVSEEYIAYLEVKDKEALAKESLFGNCLAVAIRKPTKSELEFHQSQAYVLLEKWLPNEWLEKYLAKRKEDLIKKNRRLLQ